LVASGGFLGLGKRIRAVPAQAVSAATAKTGVVLLDISFARWVRAPAVHGGALAWSSRPGTAQRLEQCYGLAKPGGVLAAAPGEKRPGEPPAPGQEAGLELASAIIGRPVGNRQHQALGEVTDLLVDLSNRRPVLAIVAAGDWLNHNQDFAVLLRSLWLNSEGELVMDANRHMFEEAPPLDEHAWQSAAGHSASEVYRLAAASGTADEQADTTWKDNPRRPGTTLQRKVHYG